MHFTLKTNPLTRSDLDDFVACFRPENRHDRKDIRGEASPEGRWLRKSPSTCRPRRSSSPRWRRN